MAKKHSLNYKTMLEKSMPVMMDCVDVEDGGEVERMWLANMEDGKWVEDYATIKRTTYDIVTEEDGAVFALIENGRMLVKAPNVKHYRIPENVYRLAANAFKECTELMALDVPYNVSEYEVGKAIKHAPNIMNIRVWNWAYDNTRSEELEKEIAEGETDEYGFVYSQDHKRLLKAATVETYWIPEGVEKIDRLAFVGCTFEELNVPYTCKLDELSEEEYPIFGSDRVQGCVLVWDRPYSQEDEIEDSLYVCKGAKITDEDGVTYSGSQKRLLWSKQTFDKTEYYVPDGVETICSNAFAHCKSFLTLSIPSSVKVIGDGLFGQEGGEIVIRKTGDATGAVE